MGAKAADGFLPLATKMSNIEQLKVRGVSSIEHCTFRRVANLKRTL
jgi:hypothetical protein